MAWAALDTARQLLNDDRWNAERDAIKAEVLARGFNAKLNSFVSEYDGDELDASLLYVARVGFLPPDDPRMLGTINAIRAALAHDDLVFRYDTRRTDDGFPSGEGAFLACSFWLATCLAMQGRIDEARAAFERSSATANHLGLFAEEYAPRGREPLGNFPQALTHLSHIEASVALERAENLVQVS
jgi:GH15 family glucan-1,4-alpha-glucosidase